MKHDAKTTAETPAPFRRPMVVARLSRNSETPFRVSAEPDELAALASFLNVDRIDRLSLAGFISPAANGGWRVRGRLVAKIEQSCVVSLEPVRSRHDAEIERLYLPADQMVSVAEVTILHDEEDLPDPFTDSIDPAQLAVESLALMIEPYPRAPGAELPSGSLASTGEAIAADDETRPFARLSVLKPDRNGNGR